MTRCDAAARSRAERRKQTLSFRRQPLALFAERRSQGAAALGCPRFISARSPLAVDCSQSIVLASMRASSGVCCSLEVDIVFQRRMQR